MVTQGPVSQLTGSGSVRVRTPQPAELRAALERAGLAVTPQGDGALLVEAPDAAQVGELAFRAGVPLHELTPLATSLEEAFLALTSDPPESS